MRTLQRTLENFKIAAPMEYDVPLREYTTFRIGGPAEVMAFPRTSEELQDLLSAIAATEIPLTVLGGGANVVVSDQGVAGLVVYTGGLNTLSIQGTVLRAGAGRRISETAADAVNHGLQGLEFIYAMPGSVGGAVWMNARCYDGEISEVLAAVTYVTRQGIPGRYIADSRDFSYKVSPFQDGLRIIVEAEFQLRHAPEDVTQLRDRMAAIEEDRRRKGHFDAPCAGSVFKNDRRFGEPSGKIIDRLGLRGLRRGGAQVSNSHGNIIINTGEATAQDIRDLVTEIRDRVYRETSFVLEPEILFLGEWT